MQRRNFLRTLLGGALTPVLGCESQPVQTANLAFEHGVASGDPLTDRVILWTRVSGSTGADVDVRWQIAADRRMRQIISNGQFRTGAERDYTVKVDAKGLPAGRKLYYQFYAGEAQSPIGRTRTLPLDTPARASFAVVSCSNHPYGYFHVYQDIAVRDNIDAVIHLGDYIYEYGLGEYATERAEEFDRVPQPQTRLVSLADYRLRHAQYKADRDSQAMHAAHPLIAVWDDHELANDAWSGGAENHRDGDGRWQHRRDAAIQAWLEWMPVRVSHESGETQIFRSYRYGDLLSLIMLDTRIFGRDIQPDAGPDLSPESVGAAMQDPERRLLGARQERWLERTLEEAGGTVWQLIGQQVMVLPLTSPDLEPLLDLERESLLPREQLEAYIAQSKGNPPMLLDTWNGYPLAREDFLHTLKRNAVNPVILSGDLHTSLAGDLVPRGGGEAVAVELMTSSVTSPGFAEYLPQRSPTALRDATTAQNPGLRYMETTRRGWLLVRLTSDACSAEWRLVNTVHSRDHVFDVDKRLQVRAGQIRDGLQPG